MDDAAKFLLDDLLSKYASQPASARFLRLYGDDEEFGHMFAILHERLNGHLESVNDRALSTHHYWANNSREFIALIREIRDDLEQLKFAGISVTFSAVCEQSIQRCLPWLRTSDGSTIPDHFAQLDVVKYEPIFRRDLGTVKLAKSVVDLKLTMVGEGSYARVFSYVDPDYDIKFAVKRAKKGITERDLQRFKDEFAVMKRLSFPYIVQVYRFDDERLEYRMEYCDETLRSYFRRRNQQLKFASRKRIALQLLYALNYIHREGLLHRDISLQNILLKVFSQGAVVVKLSDFGLVKQADSTYTRSNTEVRGTIRDPYLASFADYNISNEMYSIGVVLSFIFTGKESLQVDAGIANAIIQRCVDHDVERRYPTVAEVIRDVDALSAPQVTGSA